MAKNYNYDPYEEEFHEHKHDDDRTSQLELNGKNTNLCPVFIDGINVALEHGNRLEISCKGINLAVEYFHKRGHKRVEVLIPYCKRKESFNDYPITNPEILEQLQQVKLLQYTPRNLEVDRFIIESAIHSNGIIVTNTTFRSLENQEIKEQLNKRVLHYTFQNGAFSPTAESCRRVNEVLSGRPKDMSSNGNSKFEKYVSSASKHVKSLITELQPALTNINKSEHTPPRSNRINTNNEQRFSQHQQQQQQREFRNTRGLVQTTALYNQLSEMFPHSQREILKLLNTHPHETNVDFFVNLLSY